MYLCQEQSKKNPKTDLTIFPKKPFKYGLLATCLGLTACFGPKDITPVESFQGVVVADEPVSVSIAHDIIRAGGNAADAATALYFALSVAYPSQVSLGAGGVCLVKEPKKIPEAVEFYPIPSLLPDKSQGVSRPTAIPRGPRAFFALQARYGQMRWGQTVAPAENLARFGVRASRAFTKDLSLSGNFIYKDKMAQKIFVSAPNTPLREGDEFKQPELATILAILRDQGISPLYTGKYQAGFIKSYRAAGGTLVKEDFARTIPGFSPAIKVRTRNGYLWLTPPPAGIAATSAQIIKLFEEIDDYEDLDPVPQLHLLAESTLRSFADRYQWLGLTREIPEAISDVFRDNVLEAQMQNFNPDVHVPLRDLQTISKPIIENQAGSGFSVVDRDGMAVACTLSLNNAFGTGRIGPGSGIVLAASPKLTKAGPISLGPMMRTLGETSAIEGVYTATGGVLASTALVRFLFELDDLDIDAEDQLLEAALLKPRLHASNNPDILYVESGLPDEIMSGLADYGHTVKSFPSTVKARPPRVNVIHCPGGLAASNGRCFAKADPRAFGISAGGVR